MIRGPFLFRGWSFAALALVVLTTACTSRPGRAGAAAGAATDPVAGDETAATTPAEAEPQPKPRPRGRDPMSVPRPDTEGPGPGALPDSLLEPEGALGGPRVVGKAACPEDPDTRSRRKVAEDDDAFFKEKFDTALATLRSGDDQLASEIVAGALHLEPKEPWASRFRALRQEIKVRHIGTDILRIDARGVRDYVGFGEDVDLILRIRNAGTTDVVFYPPTGTGPNALSGSSFQILVRRTDRDIYAAEMSRSWTQNVPLLGCDSEPMRLVPEAYRELKVRIPADDVGGVISGIKVLEVGGDLWAGRIEAGLGEPFGRVPIRPGRVVVFPKNFEPIAAEPLGSLKKAVAVTAPVHLMIAAEFIPPESRVEAVSVLATGLATGNPSLRSPILNALELLRKAAVGTPLRPLARPLMDALTAYPDRSFEVMEGLRIVTGVSLAPDPRLWEDWWRRENQGEPGFVASDDDVGTAKDPRAHTGSR